jgi:NADPH:quinone reductase-like Zn-dependent oxidoreductase
VAHIESGKLQPLLAQTYPLREIAKARQDLESKQFLGKLVLIA